MLNISGSTSINSHVSGIGGRSNSNHLSGDMIRRLRQQQQKHQESTPKPVSSTGSTVSSAFLNDVSSKSSSAHLTQKSYDSCNSSLPQTSNTDGRVVDRSKPPPLVEIESPLKGLSKLTSSSVVPPPNAVAPNCLDRNRDVRSRPNAAPLRFSASSRLQRDTRPASPMSPAINTASHQAREGNNIMFTFVYEYMHGG